MKRLEHWTDLVLAYLLAFGEHPDLAQEGTGSASPGYRPHLLTERKGSSMPEGDIETFHKDGRWHNRIEGHELLEGGFTTKEDAVNVGRAEARLRKVEHIIRNLDGTIRERNTYGHDPRDIPG